MLPIGNLRNSAIFINYLLLFILFIINIYRTKKIKKMFVIDYYMGLSTIFSLYYIIIIIVTF